MSQPKKTARIELLPFVVILAIYIIGLIIFLPKMLYPFGDTWFYSRNVIDILESGKMKFTQAQAALPVFQIGLGALVCKLTGGFAFWKLNMLTYVFSFAAAVYTYRFIRLFTRGPSLALLGTLLLIGMPPFFKMSLAFMTDIYFYTGMIFAFYYGAMYILSGVDTGRSSNRYALLSSIGFIIAILSRTNALVTYLAFLLYVIINYRKLKPKVLTWCICLLPLIVFIIFSAWLQFTDSLPKHAWLVPRHTAHDLKNALTSMAFFPFIWARVIAVVQWAGYFGAILLPVTLWIFIRSSPKWRGGEGNKIGFKQAKLIWLILLPLLLLTAILLISGDSKLILTPNTITEYGMGFKPDLLPGPDKVLGDDFFNYLKFFICIGGILLWVAAMGRVLIGADLRNSGLFLWFMLVSTAIFPLLTFIFSDRYLVPLFPLLFILFAGSLDRDKPLPRWSWVFPIVLIIGSGLLANEFFGWTTAIWKANPAPLSCIDRESAAETPDIEAGLAYTVLRYYDDSKYLAGTKLRVAYELRGELPPEDEPGAYPPYIYWGYLPRDYDIVVREEDGDVPVKVKQVDAEWEIIRRAEYKPFPWSKPRSLAAYALRE